MRGRGRTASSEVRRVTGVSDSAFPSSALPDAIASINQPTDEMCSKGNNAQTSKEKENHEY